MPPLEKGEVRCVKPINSISTTQLGHGGGGGRRSCTASACARFGFYNLERRELGRRCQPWWRVLPRRSIPIANRRVIWRKSYRFYTLLCLNSTAAPLPRRERGQGQRGLRKGWGAVGGGGRVRSEEEEEEEEEDRERERDSNSKNLFYKDCSSC